MTLNTRATHPKGSPIDCDGTLLTNAQCRTCVRVCSMIAIARIPYRDKFRVRLYNIKRLCLTRRPMMQ